LHAACDGVIFLPDPVISLEAPHSRKNSIKAIDKHVWHGRVPRLTLMLPADGSADPRLPALLAFFCDYTPGEWRRRTIDGWLFFTAGIPDPEATHTPHPPPS
jgi:hypothetical protein